MFRATLVVLLLVSGLARGNSCANPPNFFMCNLDYEPVVCTVWRYQSEPLDPPIEVKASNSCFADMIIDSKICAMGKDPDALYETDVICKVLPHE